jgi:hypothetical protein
MLKNQQQPQQQSQQQAEHNLHLLVVQLPDYRQQQPL